MEAVVTVILMRLQQVEIATGLKKSSIYQRIKEGSFPAPVRLGPKAVAWRSDCISRWIDECPQAWQEEGR